MTTARTRNRRHAHLVWGILIACVLLALPALAQDPVVTAADPPSAEQETIDLEVPITGDNFDKDAEVRFLVTGTENEGGIHVKKVKSLGPGKLKATVDVDADAVVDDFDIEVMSRGRTGKGIELFRVIEKVNPAQDTIPPGDVTVQLVGTSYNEVFLEWIAPADDGYDPASGSILTYDADCIEGDVIIDPSTWGQERPGCWIWDSTFDYARSSWAEAPGNLESVRITGGQAGFRPGTTYSLAIRARDLARNSSGISNTVTFTTEEFGIGEGWTVQRVPFSIGQPLGHGFDTEGHPVIAALYDGHIRILTGTSIGADGQWQWTAEDVSGSADSFALDSSGTPVFAWMKRINLRRYQVVYTFFDGIEWVTEVVENDNSQEWGPVNLSFDLDGRPVLSYYLGGDVKLARRTASGDWAIDVVANEPGIEKGPRALIALAFDSSGTPAVAYSVDVDREDGFLEPDAVKFATLVDGNWHVEEVFARPRSGGEGLACQLAFDVEAGNFAILNSSELVAAEMCRRAGQAWSCGEAFPAQPPDFCGFPACPVPRWLAIDGFGDIFAPYQIGRSVRLASSADGATWAQEFIDSTSWRPEFYESSIGINPAGPFLALDPSASPTLSWMWKRDDWQPGDFDLYFAWKP
jgi:hypothetical protein